MSLRDQIDITTELELAQAREIREAALLQPEPDDDVIQKAEARFGKAQKDRIEYLETALKEASTSKPAPKELAEKFDIGDYLKATWHKQPLDGAMKELNDELGLSSDLDSQGAVNLPGGLFFADMRRREEMHAMIESGDIEMAADANTLVTNVTNAQPLNRGPITPLVYSRNIADFIGIDTPVVAPGKQSYPYLSSGAAVAFVAEGAQQDSVAAAFSKVDITPVRCTGAFTLSTDAMLDVGPEVQSILENDLQWSLMELVDTQLMTGNGTAPNLKGIVTQLSSAELWSGDPTSEDGDAFTWIKYRQGVNAHFDDKYFFEPAAFPGLHRLIIGDETLKHATGVMNSTTQPTVDALDAIRGKGVPIRPSGRIPNATARTSNKGRFEVGIFFNTMYSRNVVMPQWQQTQLLVDPYSQGRKGILEISLRRYIGLGYRRSSSSAIEGFKKVEFILQDES